MSTSDCTAFSEMPGQSEKPVNVFISYHRNDAVIAQALDEALTKFNGDRVNCFLDTARVGSGEAWEDKLTGALRCSDWLVCVFTGDQSEYCGYEIGVFREAHQLRPSDCRLVCLHDVKEVPIVFGKYQNKLVSFAPDPPPHEFDEKDFYDQSPLAQFFSDFYDYKDLYVAKGTQEVKRRQERVIENAKTVTGAFQKARSKDRKWKKFLQLRLELRVQDGGGERGQTFVNVPDNAEVLAEYKTFSLFNASPPPNPDGPLFKTTWNELRVAQSASSMSTTWMDKIERDIFAEVRGFRGRSGADITFQSGDKILRPVLGQHEYFKDGSRRLSIQFIETIPRQFLGRRQTSLLLAGLIIGSRFRFAHFEEADEQYRTRFNEGVSDRDFRINCRQLRYDLERVEQESAEYGLLDRGAFVAAFPEEDRALVEHFGTTWDTEKSKLFKMLPTREDQSFSRVEVQAAIFAFFAVMRTENATFLLKCVDVYHGELSVQLHPIVSGAG